MNDKLSEREFIKHLWWLLQINPKDALKSIEEYLGEKEVEQLKNN